MKNKKYRILYVIDHLGVGGAQVHLINLISKLNANEKFNLTVCSFQSKNNIHGKKIEQLGVKVFYLSSNTKRINIFSVITKLNSILNNGDFDLVHTFLEASFFIAVPLSRIKNITVVHSFMSVLDQMSFWYKKSLVFYKRITDRFIKTYRIIGDDEIIHDKNILRFAPIAIDVSPYRKIKREVRAINNEEDESQDFPVIISVGRLNIDKGHQFIISAWDNIKERFPNSKLLIIGTGKYETELREISKKSSNSNSIIFMGYRNDLPIIYSKADLFFRGSINEGANLSTIYAHAAGLPVIGFENNIYGECIIDKKNGILLKSKSVAEICDAVTTIFDIKSNNIYNSNYSISSSYNLDESAIKHTEIYLELLHEE
jgi:glycosyltransferase involved in cell wall biosynthesis